MQRLLALLFIGAAAAQVQFQCPDDGFWRDPVQCDKYFDCYRGTVTEKLCPDGLVFDSTLGERVEQCNYPFIVDCEPGSTLQAPIPSGVQCPRQNGYFEHEKASNCVDYYECTNGVAKLYSCAAGLVFDEFTGTCEWESKGIRQGCEKKVFVLEDGFACPDNSTQAHTNGHDLDHTRYLNPNDCRFFYVCEGGRNPRKAGCPVGQVFNEFSLLCDAPENVPGCENYYDGLDLGIGGIGGSNPGKPFN